MVFQSNRYAERIRFSNNTTIDKERNKGGKNHRYKLQKKNKIGAFEFSNYINEHFTLVKLMDAIFNVSNAVIIYGFWIYDLNCEKALPLIK